MQIVPQEVHPKTPAEAVGFHSVGNQNLSIMSPSQPSPSPWSSPATLAATTSSKDGLHTTSSSG